ncbi:TPA: hypothetical protein L9L57_005589, partial [Klebsiella pneumoniae]|nr:hypothetical protein [Klebsiella pneumoniae]HBR1478599.1 hypothetical protein [Klebsiella pneumoniae]
RPGCQKACVLPENPASYRVVRTKSYLFNKAMKLDYLWRSCTGNLKQQSDLFRLTYAMETAKENRRVYRLLSDSEWQGRNKLKLDPELNGIYLLKASLNTGFDGEGNQTGPLKVKITGNVAGLMIFLDTCDWQAVPEEECWYLAARN